MGAPYHEGVIYEDTIVEVGDWVCVDFAYHDGDWWNPLYYGIILSKGVNRNHNFALANLRRFFDVEGGINEQYPSEVHYQNLRLYAPSDDELLRYSLAVMKG